MQIGKLYANIGTREGSLYLEGEQSFLGEFEFATLGRRFCVQYKFSMDSFDEVFSQIKKVERNIENMLEPYTEKIGNSADVLKCIENLEKQARTEYDRKIKQRNKSLLDRDL